MKYKISNYNDFNRINNYMKNSHMFRVCRIDSVSFKNNLCSVTFIDNNEILFDRSIIDLVSAVSNQLLCVSNPSKLKEWDFKKLYTDVKINKKLENKEKDILYNKNNIIRLCHGSQNIVKMPQYRHKDSKVDNDYGYGFYTVFEQNKELAKEWACSEYNTTGIGLVNTYEMNVEDLNILNLDKYDIIVWVAITSRYRGIKSSSNRDDLKLIQKHYLIDLDNYDCIYGWRCDDTFSNIIKLFIKNELTSDALIEAIHLGNLQTQFVLHSKKSFNNIVYVEHERVKNFNKYQQKFINRKNLSVRSLCDCQYHYPLGKRFRDYVEELK